MRNFIVCTVLLGLAACSPVRTVTPEPPISAPTLEPATAAPGSSPATQPPAAATSTPADLGPVALQVLSPVDGTVVNTPAITVSGVASPGAVVTVNDDIQVAGTDGSFQSNVALTEGINVIEIIASNTSGSEATIELTVTYQP